MAECMVTHFLGLVYDLGAPCPSLRRGIVTTAAWHVLRRSAAPQCRVLPCARDGCGLPIALSALVPWSWVVRARACVGETSCRQAPGGQSDGLRDLT